jgi:hypothetical protein
MHDGTFAIFPILMVVWGMGLITFIAVRAMGWRHREKKIEARMSEQQALLQHSAPTLDQVQMLEDRMRVLEKIVTDRGYILADDIEALRDRKREEKKEAL